MFSNFLSTRRLESNYCETSSQRLTIVGSVMIRLYIRIFLVILLQNELKSVIGSKDVSSQAYLCANSDCSLKIADGITHTNYHRKEKGFLSFKKNQAVGIFAKSSVVTVEHLLIELNGKRGFAPKNLIRETAQHVSHSKLKIVVLPERLSGNVTTTPPPTSPSLSTSSEQLAGQPSPSPSPEEPTTVETSTFPPVEIPTVNLIKGKINEDKKLNLHIFTFSNLHTSTTGPTKEKAENLQPMSNIPEENSINQTKISTEKEEITTDNVVAKTSSTHEETTTDIVTETPSSTQTDLSKADFLGDIKSVNDDIATNQTYESTEAVSDRNQPFDQEQNLKTESFLNSSKSAEEENQKAAEKVARTERVDDNKSDQATQTVSVSKQVQVQRSIIPDKLQNRALSDGEQAENSSSTESNADNTIKANNDDVTNSSADQPAQSEILFDNNTKSKNSSLENVPKSDAMISVQPAEHLVPSLKNDSSTEGSSSANANETGPESGFSENSQHLSNIKDGEELSLCSKNNHSQKSISKKDVASENNVEINSTKSETENPGEISSTSQGKQVVDEAGFSKQNEKVTSEDVEASTLQSSLALDSKPYSEVKQTADVEQVDKNEVNNEDVKKPSSVEALQSPNLEEKPSENVNKSSPIEDLQASKPEEKPNTVEVNIQYDSKNSVGNEKEAEDLLNQPSESLVSDIIEASDSSNNQPTASTEDLLVENSSSHSTVTMDGIDTVIAHDASSVPLVYEENIPSIVSESGDYFYFSFSALTSNYIEGLRIYMSTLTDLLPEAVKVVLYRLRVSSHAVVFTFIFGVLWVAMNLLLFVLQSFTKDRFLRNELTITQSKYFKMQIEREALHKHLTTSEEKLQETEHSLLDTQYRLNNVEKELSEVKTERNELQASVLSLGEDVQYATSAGLELNTILSDFLNSQKENVNLISKLDQVQVHAKRLEKTIEDLTRDQKFYKEENEDLQNLQERSDEEIRRLTQLFDESKKNGENLIEINKNLLVKQDAITLRLHDIENKFQAKVDQVESLNEKLGLLQEKNSELDERLNAVNKLNDDKETEIKSLKALLKRVDEARAEVDGFTDNLFSDLVDVARMKSIVEKTEEESKLTRALYEEIREENTSLLKRIQIAENSARFASEAKAKAIEEKSDAEKNLSTLSEYFKKKEVELQRELGALQVKNNQTCENMAVLQKSFSSIEAESESYRSQIESMKRELIESERTLKSQLAVMEKSAHDNWVAARIAEREVTELKNNSAVLRQQLTKSSKNLSGNDGSRTKSMDDSFQDLPTDFVMPPPPPPPNKFLPIPFGETDGDRMRNSFPFIPAGLHPPPPPPMFNNSYDNISMMASRYIPPSSQPQHQIQKSPTTWDSASNDGSHSFRGSSLSPHHPNTTFTTYSPMHSVNLGHQSSIELNQHYSNVAQPFSQPPPPHWRPNGDVTKFSQVVKNGDDNRRSASRSSVSTGSLHASNV